jgi:flagellar protein FliS
MLDELFLGLERDCNQAIECLEHDDVAGRGCALGHAVQIVGALASSLDRSIGEVLYRDLSRLYDFAGRSLLEADLTARADPIHAVRDVMRELHAGFRGAMEHRLRPTG